MAEVVVIGAGFGGLSAAHTLVRDGHSVTVFEARDRVGGRVHTVTDFIDGRRIEAGGELIGTNHHSWLRLARELGLGLSLITDDDDFEAMGLAPPLFLRGRSITGKTARRLWASVERTEHLLSALADAAIPDPEAPWSAPAAAALDAQDVGAWLTAHVSDPLARAWLEKSFYGEYGVSPDQQSLLGLLAGLAGQPDAWSTYEAFRCADGNQALARGLAARLGDRIHRSSPIDRITLDATGVTVHTAAAVQVRADAAVLAVPPSVWDRITVTPALPPGYRTQMGVVLKYLSHLDRRLWISSGAAPTGSDDVIGSLWESTDQQQGPDRIGLAVFAGGPTAEAALAAADTDAHYAGHLERIFPGYRAGLQGTRFVPWSREPWTRGGYTTPAPGEVTGALRRLNEEPWQERLFFAGEHTDARFYGFMEGALRSGARVAAKISDIF
ncbi:MAG: monoamine oxidase [Myxococcota bacterium]|jgi:monoamine oxidase